MVSGIVQFGPAGRGFSWSADIRLVHHALRVDAKLLTPTIVRIQVKSGWWSTRLL